MGKHKKNKHIERHQVDGMIICAPDPVPRKSSKGTRTGVISQLACFHGGHNASDNSWGRLALCVDVENDRAVAEYFYTEISKDARGPLEDKIIQLKAKLYDLQEELKDRSVRMGSKLTDLERQVSDLGEVPVTMSLP